MDEENSSVRRHLLVAGTGRAGTSFLVRYLAELGLDTHLGRCGKNSAWDENANAGLENLPFLTPNNVLPYVIKSPWLYQFIDNLLADGKIVPDAVVIPVRDLAEAAVSRSVIERRAIHENAHWMSGSDRSWEEWAHSPGGVVYSLNPIDQGRLLAVGFHHLVQRLVAAGIPIILLAFPKLAEDATYLFEKLRPILPQTVDHRTACSAHRRVADPAKVRVGTEIQAVAPQDMSYPTKIVGYGSHSALDLIALKRELVRVRGQLVETRNEANRANEQIRSDGVAAASEARRLNERITTLEAALAEAIAATQQTCRDKNEAEDALSDAIAAQKRARREKDEAEEARRQEVGQFHRKIEDFTCEILRLQQQAAFDSKQKWDLEAGLASIRASRSWRLTSPYRAIGSRMLNTFRKRG